MRGRDSRTQIMKFIRLFRVIRVVCGYTRLRGVVTAALAVLDVWRDPLVAYPHIPTSVHAPHMQGDGGREGGCEEG